MSDKSDRDWKDADDTMRKAREAASTTLFRWTPEWDKAATEFEAAARKYSKLGAQGLMEAVEAYKGACDAHKELKSLNSAARNMEMAAMTESKLPNGNSHAAKTYKLAAELYRDNEQTVKAAATLMTGANLVKDEDTELTQALMMQACEMFENDEERAVQGQDTFKTFIAYLCKIEEYRDAMMMIDRLNKIMMPGFETKKSFIYRNHLSVIIVALALQDIELAFNNFERFAQTGGFLDSEPSSLANELLIAFDECDDERLKQTLKNTTFNLLDAPIARIARTLAISDEVRAAASERQRKEEEQELDLT